MLALLTRDCQQGYAGGMAKQKKNLLEERIAELTADLQRVQADFVNYRNRSEEEKGRIIESQKANTIMKLLPVVDNIDRAIGHVPQELSTNSWAQGVVGLGKSLEKSLSDLGLTKINSNPGVDFDPHLHEAVMMDEGEGSHEVISENLRDGYKLNDQVIRPAMVKVARVNQTNVDQGGNPDDRNTETHQIIHESKSSEEPDDLPRGED